MENVDNQKLEALRRYDRQTYDAVIWLRNNGHMFSGTVYEPIVTQVIKFGAISYTHAMQFCGTLAHAQEKEILSSSQYQLAILLNFLGFPFYTRSSLLKNLRQSKMCHAYIFHHLSLL